MIESKPLKPTMNNDQVTLKSSYYGLIRPDFFDSVLEAAESGFWEIEHNTSQTLCMG